MSIENKSENYNNERHKQDQELMILKQDFFSIASFEGSLDFLLCLIRKEEIAIYDVPIHEIIQQFISKLLEQSEEGLDKGGEFIGIASYLVWLKSKTLLPSDEDAGEFNEEIEDPCFEIIHHLIDYCRFKQASKELALLHEKQQACFFRGTELPEVKKPLGIDHISLVDLALLFQSVLKRSVAAVPRLADENWKVSDKIEIIRSRLQTEPSFSFSSLFAVQTTRPEIIVIFLAILELIKRGELCSAHREEGEIIFIKKAENG